jgi:acetyl-CoA carboxylase beta subunit
MDWNKLRTQSCPSCGSPLYAQTFLDNTIMCRGAGCGFKISEEKMTEIISDRAKLPTFAPKLGDIELNNLGHKEQSMDYSDQQPDI